MPAPYENLIAWQKFMAMVTRIYSATKAFPRDEMFALTSQLRRAAVSIPSNIAEGKGRLSHKECRQFLATARGSLFEAETQLRIAANLRYLDAAQLTDLLSASNEVARLLNGLIRSLSPRSSVS